MTSISITGYHRCFQAPKSTIVYFLQGALGRRDAKTYFDDFREGSLPHWQGLLHALVLDITDTALLTFDEAAFIGKEITKADAASWYPQMPGRPSAYIVERLPIQDFKPEHDIVEAGSIGVAVMPGVGKHQMKPDKKPAKPKRTYKKRKKAA